MITSPLIRYIVIFFLILIVVSLFSAFISFMRRDGDRTATVKALSVRVLLSMGLLAFLLIAMKLGLIGGGE